MSETFAEAELTEDALLGGRAMLRTAVDNSGWQSACLRLKRGICCCAG